MSEVVQERTSKDFTKEVLLLALPMGWQSLITNIANVINNVMIGSLGEASISAVSVCGTYTWLSSTIITAIATGAGIIIAQDYGRGDKTNLKKLFSLTLTFNICVSLLFFAATTFFPAQIIQIYSPLPELIEPGCTYLSIIRFQIVVNTINFTIVSLFQSIRTVKLGLVNSIFSCITHVFLNWVLIGGNLGFKPMGVAGAAYGTLIAKCVELAISASFLFFIDKKIQYRFADYNPVITKQLLKEFVIICIPLIMIDVLSNFASTVQTMISGRISQYYIAANSIVHMAWMIPQTFCMGVGRAAGVMTGNMIGRGDYDNARKDAKRFITMSFYMGIFCAVMVQVLVPILSSYYNVMDETLLLAKQMGYSASINVFFFTFNSVICNGVIRSTGDTKRILKVDLLGTWLFALPFGWLAAFTFKWPAAVIYMIVRSINIIKAVWGLIVLKKDNWIIQISKDQATA